MPNAQLPADRSRQTVVTGTEDDVAGIVGMKAGSDVREELQLPGGVECQVETGTENSPPSRAGTMRQFIGTARETISHGKSKEIRPQTQIRAQSRCKLRLESRPLVELQLPIVRVDAGPQPGSRPLCVQRDISIVQATAASGGQEPGATERALH